MRKILVVLLVLFFAVPLMAKDKPEFKLKDKPDTVYRVMEFTLAGSIMLDTVSTRYVLMKSGFREVIPHQRWFMKNDFRAIMITALEVVVVTWGLEKLKEYNKTLGYIVMGVIIAARTYAVISNFQNLSHY